MNVRREIELYALPEDRPILLWLFERYHWASQWSFVTTCTHQRYGVYSYQTHRVWAPTAEGRVLYEHANPWQPITTAPADDGHVVLTNEGFARQCSAGEAAYWCVKPGWFSCSVSGYIFECADNGISGSRIEPTVWMEIPTLPAHEK